jgi:hypothetical protein
MQHLDLAKDVDVEPTVGFGRSVAIRKAAQNAADVTASDSAHVTRLVGPVDLPPDQADIGPTSRPGTGSGVRL